MNANILYSTYQNRLLGIITAVAILYLFLISFTPDFLTGTPEYRWPVLHHGVPWRALPAAAILMLAAFLILTVFKDAEEIFTTGKGRMKLFTTLFCFGLLTQITAASVHRFGMVELPLRVYLPDHTSYFTDAVKIDDFREFSREYPALIKNLSTHSRTHPPGDIAFFYLVNQAAARFPGLVRDYREAMPASDEAMEKFGLRPAQAAGGGLAGLLLILCTALAGPLAYRAGKYFMESRAALLGAMLFILTPAFSHKTPLMDQAFGVFILAAVLLILHAINRQGKISAGLAGLIAGCGLWFSSTFLASFPLIALLSLALVLQERAANRSYRAALASLLTPLAIFIICAAAGLMLGRVIFRVSYIDVYRAITDTGWMINNTASGRIHAWLWILFNPYELLAWQGMPVAVLVIAAGLRESGRLLKRDFTGADWFVVAVIFFCVLLDASGRVCYESARLCWFLIPFVCLAAAKYFYRSVDTVRTFHQAVIFLLMIASVMVFRLLF